jgi:hypothetical protein
VSKVDEAISILVSLGLPSAQQNERSALTLLALAKLGPEDAWVKVQRPLLRIWDIMGYMRDVHGKDYAANSRETIRRQTIHQFEQARIVDRNPDDPDRPTNSGKTVYVLTEEAAAVLRTHGKPAFKKAVKEFIEQFGSLKIAYDKVRDTHRIPLRLPDGVTVYLSPGEHNALQVAIIEEFGPRFAPGADVLYVGDTAKKHVIFERDQLASLGIPITEHDQIARRRALRSRQGMAVHDRGRYIARAGVAETASGNRVISGEVSGRTGLRDGLSLNCRFS